ncbi:MAG TPA: 3-hydroxyacyl-ACP dehydratase FabZ [Burkholderiales bacterium]|jgi:3-hydroxyacyl-[acyl-carrier-protein] dehydratase|nr:3-hydroxyacyl-ACP dehydratase FabZ [Burkholderiales bacterium]
MSVMDIKTVLERLPHRYPFLLVDRVLECEAGKRILALKNVTINEPFFPGHFPHHPIMPGVMLIEAMAQAAAILAFESSKLRPDDKSVVYFLGIDEARFKSPVVPGDQLMLEARIERHLKGVWKFAAEARVGERLAAVAKMMCALRDA